MADWASLHEDILYLILKKSKSIEDAPRFSATCKQWRNCSSINKKRLPCLLNPYPWLILPSEKFLVPFVKLSDNKFYKYSFTKDKSWGTPYGWSVHLGNGGIYLMNPISKSRKRLPPLEVDASEVRKAVLLKQKSSSNTLGDQGFEFVVWLLFRGHSELMYAKPGDNAWRTTSEHFCKCQDIIYFDEEIFLFERHGLVSIRDIWSPIPQILGCPLDFDHPISSYSRYYLVTLREELHILMKYDKPTTPTYWGVDYRDIGFRVYKFNLSTGIATTVTSLGDYAIFVGNNTSFSLVVSNDSKIKPSCIYFTDDSVNGAHFKFADRAFGIFDIERSRLVHLWTAGRGSFYDISFRSQEYWIVPMM